MLKKLEAIERIVVIIAALLAVVPVVIYISETKARDLDRTANFITAFQACEKFAPPEGAVSDGPIEGFKPIDLDASGHDPEKPWLDAQTRACLKIVKWNLENDYE